MRRSKTFTDVVKCSEHSPERAVTVPLLLQERLSFYLHARDAAYLVTVYLHHVRSFRSGLFMH